MATKGKAKKDTPQKGNGTSEMTDLLRRPLLISVGLLALAEEQASSLIDSLIERGEKAEKAGEKYIKKLNKNASKAFKKSKKAVKKRQPKGDLIERTLHRLNVPSRNDIDKLNKKVDTLMRKVA